MQSRKQLLSTEAFIKIVVYIQARHIQARTVETYHWRTAGERKQAPFGKRGEARVLSLAGAADMSGKEKLDQEMPIPPGVEEWVHAAEMQYNVET